MNKSFIENLLRWGHIDPILGYKILISLFFTGLFYILKSISHRIINTHIKDLRTRYFARKRIDYILFAVTAFFIFRIWVLDIGSLGTFLGLLSAGVAVALKDPLMDLAGWMFMLWRKPFTVGDRIQIGPHKGDVIDIRPFQFTLLEIENWVKAEQSTGRVIHIPNSRVLTEMVANYTQSFEYIWNEIPVLVTFESNYKKAKKILLKIARKHAEHLSRDAEERLKEAAKKYMIIYTKFTPIVYTSVEDSGVLLTIRYLCSPRKRRETESKIWEDILDSFNQEPDVELAYPTIRYYRRGEENEQQHTKCN